MKDTKKLLEHLTSREFDSGNINRELIKLASNKAREANRGGLESQLDFLSNFIGLSDEDIMAIANDFIDDGESKKIDVYHRDYNKDAKDEL